VKEFPTVLASKLTQQLAGNRDGLPMKVFAQDETRLGLQPILRRRITACGVQPVATVWQRFDNFYLFGAVEPKTGDSFFLARIFHKRWQGPYGNPFPARSWAITAKKAIRALGGRDLDAQDRSPGGQH
jgi:hypothetical protein